MREKERERERERGREKEEERREGEREKAHSIKQKPNLIQIKNIKHNFTRKTNANLNECFEGTKLTQTYLTYTILTSPKLT